MLYWELTRPSLILPGGSHPFFTIVTCIVSKLFFYWDEVFLAFLSHSNGLFLSIDSLSNFWSYSYSKLQRSELTLNSSVFIFEDFFKKKVRVNMQSIGMLM